MQQTPPPASPQDANPIDDPRLPRVLLIGDSISFGYTPEVRRLLTGKANIHRVQGTVDATVKGTLALDTRSARKNLDYWLGSGKWAVIHFNWGLHDIKIEPDGKHQVEIAEYEKNLDELVQRLKRTGARLIWATTTPVPQGKLSPLRHPGDENAYNDIARRMMSRHNIPINDLNALAKTRPELQTKQNVHFSPEGSALLGSQVAARVRALLPPPPPA
jgi:lysophospholipase L1-like esterase